MIAANDINNIASDISTTGLNTAYSGEAYIEATSGDVNIITDTLRNRTVKRWYSKKNRGRSINDTTTNISSGLDLAGDLTITSGNDTNIKGSNIAVGGALTADSTGDLTIESAEDSTYNYYANYKRSSFGRRSKSISESTKITNVASNIEAAGGINVQSAGDINIIASKLKSSVGDINITAANALNIISASDSLESQTISSRSGVTTRSNSSTINNVTTQIASDISAANGNLSLSSGDNTTIIASDISGSGNIDIAAGTYEDSSGNVTNNTDAQVNILSSKDIDYAFQQSTKSSIGFNNIEDIVKNMEINDILQASNFVATAPAAIYQASKNTSVSESLKETIVASNITSTDNGNINISSGADTTILASNLKTTNGGDININVGQLTDGSGVIVTNDDAKVTIAGASNKETSYNKDENFNYSMSIDSDGISYANYQKDTNQDILLTNVSSNLDSANNININAKSDLSLKGSDLTTNNGDINLTSEFGKVAIASAQNYANNVTKSDSGELGFKIQKDLSIEVAEFELIDENKGSITNIASNLTATQGEININSSEDVSVLSSNLNSDNGVNIVAGNDFNLLNSHDQIWSETSSKKGTSQLKFETTSSEISAKAGVTYEQDKNTNTSTEVAASSIIANSGSINSVANNNINVVASKLIASNDIDLTATNNLNILSDDQISNSSNSSLMVDAGIRLGIDHNFGSTIESLEKLGDINVGDTINGALGIVEGIVNGEGLDGILSGNEEGINGTMRTFEAYQAFNQDPSVNVALSVNVEVDGSKSKSNSSNAVESLLLAGNDINLTTTNEDITIKGSNIDANNITLNSGNDLEIVASQNNSNSSSKSYNFEVDVDIIGTNGVGATNINGNIANNKNTSVTNNNSLITASNNLVINTDNDTNISGANLIASNDLVVTTGNNLNIESLQDNIKSDNSSLGFDFGVGANGISANVNAAKGKASKQWVNNQTDLIGKNSVTITTGNNTNLVGAVIANTKADGADGGNLTINTASLTYQDIKDKDKARSSSLGVGYGNDPDTGAQQSGSFNFGYSSHDIAQITRSTIGNGTINIAANSDISGLNRDIAKSQEITKNQVVGNVSGTIKFTSGGSDEDKESNKDDENNKSDSKASIKDKTVAFLKSQGDQAKEWLRADKAITGSVKKAAKSAGATDLEKSIERGENRIDAGLDAAIVAASDNFTGKGENSSFTTIFKENVKVEDKNSDLLRNKQELAQNLHGLTKLDANGVQDSLEETAQFITENGDTDLLIYQGNETGGAYQVIEAGAIEGKDLIIVNTNKTDLADSGDVINKLYHEGYHVSNRNETEAQAIRFGDYAESDWVSKSKDYGYKNTNLITSTQWNQENANSSIVLQNNNVVQGQDFEKVETIIPLIVAAAITSGLAYKGEGDAFNGAKELRQEFSETEVGQAVAKGSEIIATNIIKGADYSLEALTNEEALATKALIELNEQYQKLPEGTRDVLDFAGFVFAAAGSAQLGKAATHKI